MDAFDRAIKQNLADDRSYRQAVATQIYRDQNRTTVAGKFIGRDRSGYLKFQTPGGGTRVVFSNSPGGYQTNAVAELSSYGGEVGFAHTSAPQSVPREEVRGGLLI